MLIVQRITQKTTLCKNGTDELNLCILQSTGPAEKIVPDCVTSAQIKICPIVTKAGRKTGSAQR